MINTEPFNQRKLFGLDKYMNNLINLYKIKKLPNKILLSGQKGQGKSTLAYHFINFVLSQNEKFHYNEIDFVINDENSTFKTIQNKSNPNLALIDLNIEKKTIDILQIRELILNLNKSSFNDKPRFVLIDNIEFLNTNSINALLKVIEEPSDNIFFILINNNKKILSTLLSRCINFKISLSNKENLLISQKILQENLFEVINKDLINYYSTPGYIYYLYFFAKNNDYDLSNLSLGALLKKIIKDKHYKKNSSIDFIIHDLIELYLSRLNLSISTKFFDNYGYFIQKLSNIKKFNLDSESLFLEFEDRVLNG